MTQKSPSTNTTLLEIQKDRNKLNQRAFRARRQQRVQDLEAKLRQYESTQLKATQQMQQAARVVAAENAMLRDVLKTRLGLGEREIEALRRDWITGNSGSNDDRVHVDVEQRREGVGIRVDDSARQRQQQQQQQQHELRNAGSTQPAAYIPVDQQLANPLPAPKMKQTHKASPTNICNSKTQTNHHNSSDCCYPGAAYTNMSSVSTMPFADTTSAFMSCEKAAEILSSIRTQDELHDVRARLGCTSTNTCMIENTTVMDVMNESI